VLAQVYEHEGQLEAALAAYRRAVYLDRDFVLAALGMANVWRQVGQFAEARRGYRGLIRRLSALAPRAPIPGADNATAAELIALANHYMQAMPSE
jgi:chemotaxis protein methyltransferase CheR